MKKQFLVIFSLIFAFTMLSQTYAISANAKSKKPVTISFWHLDSQSAWQEQADDFMKANPHVKIKITVLANEAFKQKLATVMQAGSPPDLFRSWGGHSMNQYVEAGMLRDITKEIRSANLGIAKGPLGVYSYKGRVYGVPYNMGAVGIWYNKKIFRKYGLREFRTWKEFIAGCKKLRKSGVIPIALGEQDKWPGHFWYAYIAMRLNGSNGFHNVYSGREKFTDKGYIETFRKIDELVSIGAFQGDFLGSTYNDQSSLVANGKAAMELMGQWAPGVQEMQTSDKKGLGDDLGFMSFPAIRGGKGKITDMFGGGDGFCVGKNAPEEAVDFLKFIMSKKQYKKLYDSPISFIPVIKGSEIWVKDPKMRKLTETILKSDYQQLYLDQHFPTSVGGAMLDAVQGVMYETKSPEEAAAMMQKAWDDAK